MTDRPGLSRESLVVVVAVCAAVAALVLLVFILRSRRNSAVPLPPVQPLAHHREQQQSKWHGDQPPRLSPGTLSSRSSLLPKHSRPSSSVPDDVSPLSSNFPLPLPSRSFQDLAQSSSSFVSTDTDLPSTPPSSLPRRPRPLSTSSLNTAASRNTLHGVPHAPYNQIQIVLPSPLAPSPHRRPSLQGDLHDGARLSTVDMWVPVGRDNLRTPGLRSHINPRSSLRISSPPLPLSDLAPSFASMQHPSFYQSPDSTTTPEKV